MAADFKSKFMEVFSILKSDALTDPAIEFTENNRLIFDWILDSHIPKVKLDLGLSIINSYKLLKMGEELTEDEIFFACSLGWCMESIRASFDFINSVANESNHCLDETFPLKLPKVVIMGANIGTKLHSHAHIMRIVKKNFKGKPYYVDLLELFNEVEFLTTHGQLLFWVTTCVEVNDLSKFTMSSYRRIIEYRTAYYSFYLPVACALLMFGESLDKHGDTKETLIEMGIYFQVQADYLDCFGDPNETGTGKVGINIEKFKYSWLVLKALELSNDDQKKTLNENYGKNDPACVAKVIELYEDLKLQDVYFEYEKATYKKIIELIESHPRKEVQEVLHSFLRKVY